MPVTSTSEPVLYSSNFGGSRWMGSRVSASTGPFSSTGSPTTLSTRPSVAGPTGIVIGLPVSVASTPRRRPSVESIATVRTTFSPRCCSTSSTRLPSPPPSAGLVVRSAAKTGGSSPSGNSTSTTGPRIWTILPLFAVSFSIAVLR